MGQVSFGTVLREARERKGYDVQSAARRLRIRPDILRALENNDFSRLPARGYTRNMVNAYAKLVGLNPADITRMYLDDAYAYQVGRTRGESDSPAHVSGRRSVSRGDGRHDGDVGIVQPDRRVRTVQENILRIRRDDDPQVDVAVRTGEPVRVAAAHPCGEHATGHVGCERLFETVHRSIPNDSR